MALSRSFTARGAQSQDDDPLGVLSGSGMPTDASASDASAGGAGDPTAAGSANPAIPDPGSLLEGGFDPNTGAMTGNPGGDTGGPTPQPFTGSSNEIAPTNRIPSLGAQIAGGSTIGATNDPANNPGGGFTSGTGDASGGGANMSTGGNYADPSTMATTLLGSGYDPQNVITQVNSQFSLPYGQSYAWRAIAGAPGGGVIEVPGGAYYALGADGKWGYNAGDSGGSGTPANPGGGDGLGPQPTPPGGTIPVGTDPLSGQIDNGISTLISNNGMTPEEQSVYATLADIIGRSGSSPANDQIVQNQLESARESESAANTAQTNDANAELANAGLVSEPGVAQGLQGGAIQRISQGLAPTYAGAVRDINTTSIQAQNDRLTTALTQITGLTTSAASNLLNTLGQGTQRQSAIATIALDSLSQNASWNEFLANYGLSRDQIAASIANGNASALGPLITLFESLTGTAAAGSIG